MKSSEQVFCTHHARGLRRIRTGLTVHFQANISMKNTNDACMLPGEQYMPCRRIALYISLVFVAGWRLALGGVSLWLRLSTRCISDNCLPTVFAFRLNSLSVWVCCPPCHHAINYNMVPLLTIEYGYRCAHTSVCLRIFKDTGYTDFKGWCESVTSIRSFCRQAGCAKMVTKRSIEEGVTKKWRLLSKLG